jgi:hypothetical protein
VPRQPATEQSSREASFVFALSSKPQVLKMMLVLGLRI